MILPLFLYLFADCSFYLSEKKCIMSQEYASEHGLPKLEHVLLPKTKGFICCLQQLRSSLDAGEHHVPPSCPCIHGTFAGMICVTVARFSFFFSPLAAEYLSTNSYKPTIESSSLEF